MIPAVRRWTRLAQVLGALGACALPGSCTYWRGLERPWPAALPPEQIVEVWSRGAAVRLTAVGLDEDSLRGRVAPGDTAGVAVSFPVGAIDSLRLGQGPGASGMLLAGLGVFLVTFMVGFALNAHRME